MKVEDMSIILNNEPNYAHYYAYGWKTNVSITIPLTKFGFFHLKQLKWILCCHGSVELQIT